MNEITMKVNGRTVAGHVEPRKTLADFLRKDCGLTGVRLGCEHGVCGACTVDIDGATGRSCLALAVSADKADITTVEGLAEDGEFHPLQQAFWDKHALQCGFCTSGILMTMREFLAANPDPTEEEIREALSGNICRCTGYHFIVDAVIQAAAELRARQA